MKKSIASVIAGMLVLILEACAWSIDNEAAKLKQSQTKDANAVETILKQLNEKTSKLVSYQAQIEQLFKQPLLESQSLKTGVLYYEKLNKGSKLRIDFQTLKQDEEKQREYREQYIFDGVWLTQINYQIKSVKRSQTAEANKPADAMELAKGNFPIIGFSNIEELKKEFEISLVAKEKDEPADSVGLHLKVLPNSIYKDDYSSVNFWIDKKVGLPSKIKAVTTEEDIYEIKLLNPKVNETIAKKVFEIEVPKGFQEEIVPLKKRNK
jgi:outer membrane lipoprotein-sorting protein